MPVKTTLRSTVAAVMLLAPLAASFVAQPAHAATRATVAQPQITNMALNSDSGLSPGATLRVQLSATPNARSASITLGDSGVTVPLRQQTRGNYTGSYVVRRSDRIDPTQLITARVQFGNRNYSREFNFPPAFQALAMGAAPAAAARPALAIERFAMWPMGRLEPGRELHFRVVGAPGADAWLDIPGVIRGVDLSEVRPGVYEGTYTIRRRDDLDAFRNAVATLRNGNQKVTARADLRGEDRDTLGRDRDRDERAGDRIASTVLPLQITSHSNNMAVDANGNLAIQGRTVPFANVHVHVDAVASLGGVLGLNQPVVDQAVQADRQGYFSVAVPPRGGLPIPGTRYDVRVTATSGSQTAEEHLTLVQRQG